MPAEEFLEKVFLPDTKETRKETNLPLSSGFWTSLHKDMMSGATVAIL